MAKRGNQWYQLMGILKEITTPYAIRLILVWFRIIDKVYTVNPLYKAKFGSTEKLALYRGCQFLGLT